MYIAVIGSLGFVLFKSISMTFLYMIGLFKFRSVRRRMERFMFLY